MPLLSSSDKKSPFTPRVAVTEADKEKVYAFRRQEWGEDAGEVRDPLDDTGRLLFVESGGQVAASLRLNWMHKTAISTGEREMFALDRFFKRFSPEAVTVSSDLMVGEAFRRTEALGALLAFAYQVMREEEVQFDLTHCLPGQLQFYELLGYRRYKDNSPIKGGGYRIPLVCVVEDSMHFRSVGSLLYPIAARYSSNNEAAEWFTKESFRRAPRPGTTAPADAWGMLSDRLSSTGIPLFRGMSDVDVKQFLKAGKVIPFKQGETIIRGGQDGHEMFVVIDGEVEAMGIQNGVAVSLGSFHSGQTFGEISFLMSRRRTADVVGVSDGKLLELSQTFLREGMKKFPELTMKILLNLSVILCERLCLTTVQLLMANSEPAPAEA